MIPEIVAYVEIGDYNHPVIIDKYLAKGTAFIVDIEGVEPRPHIRTDSVETIREMVRQAYDKKFLEEVGIKPL